MEIAKNISFYQLEQEILKLEGYKPPQPRVSNKLQLGPINASFPFNQFPLHTIHEFSSTVQENAASTNAFILSLSGKILSQKRKCLWISADQLPYPNSLNKFGADANQFIFVKASNEKNLFWIIEEALKCETLGIVVALVPYLSFTESQRLQLAVEQSGVTGFIHRINATKNTTITCAARWQINPLSSVGDDGGLPGVLHPHWQVNLIKVRGGKPGSWKVKWKDDDFYFTEHQRHTIPLYPKIKTG